MFQKLSLPTLQFLLLSCSNLKIQYIFTPIEYFPVFECEKKCSVEPETRHTSEKDETFQNIENPNPWINQLNVAQMCTLKNFEGL